MVTRDEQAKKSPHCKQFSMGSLNVQLSTAGAHCRAAAHQLDCLPNFCRPPTLPVQLLCIRMYRDIDH